MIRSVAGAGSVVAMIALVWGGRSQATPSFGAAPIQTHPTGALFTTSDTCLACHNNLTTPSGEDVSIGAEWRGSMMANSSRDPYWRASVRREALDHPRAAADIEDECATCHMPMARAEARANGVKGQVFAHLGIGSTARRDLLADDGVSCTICHQISNEKLGSPESFTGGFALAPPHPDGSRRIFGPFTVDKGRTRVMSSSSGFQPTEGQHIQQAEMCASCHTLYTKALGPGGEVIGTLPEQTPYLEWRASAFRTERTTCQTCHMPETAEETPIASVLGVPRTGLSRHGFRGGNFFMLRMLNKYRADLGVMALPSELETAARATIAQLESATASVTIVRAEMANGRLTIDVDVRNATGHKLPTGYPARRVWVHLTVRDRSGQSVFESGRITASGAITGNDNDSDPLRYEPHYTEIRDADQVQIYESIMGESNGGVTTGLLRGVRFLKDNRLLPRGFDKRAVQPDIAVVGTATEDADFAAGRDRVRYAIDLGRASSPLTIEVALRFQPIAFRWAQNLKPYDSIETRRFASYYESMAAESSQVLARASASFPN